MNQDAVLTQIKHVDRTMKIYHYQHVNDRMSQQTMDKCAEQLFYINRKLTDLLDTIMYSGYKGSYAFSKMPSNSNNVDIEAFTRIIHFQTDHFWTQLNAILEAFHKRFVAIKLLYKLDNYASDEQEKILVILDEIYTRMRFLKKMLRIKNTKQSTVKV